MATAADTEILERVRRVIAKNRRNDSSTDFTAETSLEALGLDSFDAINITFALEEEFGVEIPGEGLRDVKIVADVVAMLRAALDKAAPQAVSNPSR